LEKFAYFEKSFWVFVITVNQCVWAAEREQTNTSKRKFEALEFYIFV